MRERGKIIQWIVLLILLFFIIFFPIGEGNIIILLLENQITSLYNLYFFILLILIITNLVLFSIKKGYKLVLQILVVCQSIVWIPILFEFLYIYAITFFTIILMYISILQIFNVLFKLSKGYKYASVIISFISLVCLCIYSALFYTISRFEFELNDDGKSYAITEIKSDIHTIRVPSTYKGLPVTKIESSGIYPLFNIRKIIFEDNCHIEIIEDVAFGLPKLKQLKLPSSLQSIGDNAFSSCISLEEVFIPIQVSYIKAHAFNCINATIYCEVESKPDTWDINWYYQAKNIIWGYKE